MYECECEPEGRPPTHIYSERWSRGRGGGGVEGRGFVIECAGACVSAIECVSACVSAPTYSHTLTQA